MASAKAEREERERRALKERKEAIDAARCAFAFLTVRWRGVTVTPETFSRGQMFHIHA